MRSWRLLWRFVLFMALVITGGCNVGTPRPLSEGYYLDKAQLVLAPDPDARRPSRLESGDHWIIWLSDFEKGGGMISGRGRQTTIFIEFAALPMLDQPIDLAAIPLQVNYEYGGEAFLYISREVTGTISLRKEADNTFTADLDATFINPILGDGPQILKGTFILQKHAHPDFSTP